MPLIHSSSERAFDENVRRLVREGYPQRQAVAIALRTQRDAAHANHAGRTKRAAKAPGIWVVGHNGDPSKLDEVTAGGFLAVQVSGDHRIYQAVPARRPASALAKSWMESHPPLSSAAIVEVYETLPSGARDDIGRWVGEARKRGGGFAWVAQARPRRAPPVKRARPEGYVPWKKEPQFLFADPTHRQRADLTASQFGVDPSVVTRLPQAPPPPPPPPPPVRREWSFDPKGQGGLFNMTRGRRNRAGNEWEIAQKDRKKVIGAIYRNTNVSDRHLRAERDAEGRPGVKKHSVMLVGSTARNFGVDNYYSVKLEDLSNAELYRLAYAMELFKSQRNSAGGRRNQAGEPTHPLVVPMKRIPKAYTHLVVDSAGRVLSGWEYASDARDDMRENRGIYGPTARVMARRTYDRMMGK